MFQLETTDTALICTFPQRLDTAACMELEDALLRAVAETDKVVLFDLREVGYVASLFMRLCIRVAKTVTVDRFSIVNVAPNVRKVFELVGLDRLVTLEHT